MRTLVVGDIHGGLRSLVQVLERASFDNSTDKLIFLGDYVDGWSESAQLIDYLINMQEEAESRHVFILGNHDVWCREWLNFGYANPNWLVQGGQATYNSYIKTGLFVIEGHRRFFRTLIPYYIDDNNRAFVHGGFSSDKGLGYDSENIYTWDRSIWMRFSFLGDNKLTAHKEIYIGHTAEHNTDGTPMTRCNVYNLDTGGGWSGKLSIMDIDSKEVWQSDLVMNLYPDEKGRR